MLYTDFFLSQLIESLKIKNKNAVLLYLSDHGENLFDNKLKIFGHGTVNPTKYEYHIPFITWFSDEYKNNFPHKINALKENLHKAATLTSTFYTILDMANIDYDNAKNEKNS
ncbi:sulfatase-like hydrolase/transferase [Weeksellaceae bacterium KMM 9724]|nr:sulfatase-like hydrolase/transferase [Profundicola chukchiensis]